MAPSGPTVAISCRGRLTIAKYWGKSFVTIWITFLGRRGWCSCKSAASGGCDGLLLRKELWWKGEEWWFKREPDLESDLPPSSFLGTGLELEVEVVVEDMEAVLSSMNSCSASREILSFRILAGALVIFEKLDFEKKGAGVVEWNSWNAFYEIQVSSCIRCSKAFLALTRFVFTKV